MATRTKPAPAPADAYEQDFYAWAQTQAELLRAGRFDELDLANLIEEVAELGGSLHRKVRNRALTIMVHLLKLQHSLSSAPRLGWRETVRAQRSRLLDELTPTLRRRLTDELPELYARARHDAEGSLRDHGEPGAAAALPEVCPYTLDQIMGDWLP